MSTKPFKNGRGVDKPFCSPFTTPHRNDDDKGILIDAPRASKSEPLKSLSMKRLFEETPPRKRSRSSTENDNDDRISEEKNKVLYRSDLESLKERIREKEVSLAALKTSLLYRKKVRETIERDVLFIEIIFRQNEDLEGAIEKWIGGCQAALQDYQEHLRERNGQNVSMSDILSFFDITPDKVCYSVDDDTFSPRKC
ncbi:uncharacterized protein LOC108630721 isoform X1 [Ceratina calcarata]|uniref:Uncharacterized protein LOC108630721 isoform X1 n=1 Tax=Ceratina calcarata TaxID=156304 RepID=A0AAJ7NDC7_9HYME|nr:uncharacterized protein LOC108630721 isoform X1 [Ceratina calcarata]